MIAAPIAKPCGVFAMFWVYLMKRDYDNMYLEKRDGQDDYEYILANRKSKCQMKITKCHKPALAKHCKRRWTQKVYPFVMYQIASNLLMNMFGA